MKTKTNFGPVRPRKHSTIPGGSHKGLVIPDAHDGMKAENAAKHDAQVAEMRDAQRIARQTEK